MPPTEKSAAAGRLAGRGDPSSAALGLSDRHDDLSEGGDLDPALFELFEQITRWLDAGMPVDEEQLVAENPAWAREIRDLVPTLRGMAKAGTLRLGAAAPSLADARDAEGRRVVGDFHIVREIGRGGMGVVYEAEQAPLGRRVALKILPLAASLDPRALQRFQLEAQVAGWLQHPRIVPVYAVGLANEIPYFAMQYIEGGSLGSLIGELRGLAERGSGTVADHACGDSPSALALGLLSGRFAPSSRDGDSDRHHPSAAAAADKPAIKAPPSIRGNAYLRTVAHLGMQAAEALGYAHDQGIIHRDVKPANLLLDKRGDLWVADFGMAGVQGDAGLTLSGDLPGTLRYMSPEQATGQRAMVDRRTDIYSLGATLYELLTLQPAVTGSDKVEIIRRIAEEEPVPIRRRNPAVPVDLATIVTKAISKSPGSRYETALTLANDLDRFLEGRPIAARPVGVLLRSWRWCRRKPMQAGLAAALGLALVGGLAGITWNWREAVRQKQEALLQKHEALHQKQEAVRQEQEAMRQKGLLAVSQGRAEASEKKALALAARADAINRFLIDKLLRQAAPQNNSASKRVTLLEALDHAAGEVGSSFPGQPEIEAAIRLAIGETYHDLGDYGKSVMHYRAAYDIHRQKSDDTGLGRLEAMTGLGHSLVHMGRLDEAEPLLVNAAEEARRVHGPTHEPSLTSVGFLATLRQQQGRDSDAEALYRWLVGESRRARGPKHPETVTAINNLGTLLEKEKKYQEAERLFRECLELRREIQGPQHPATITSLFNLGFVLRDLGRFDEAEKLIRQSLDLRRQVLGPEHPETLLTTRGLASVLTRTGRLDDAEKILRSSLETSGRARGRNDQGTVDIAKQLDDLLKDRSRHAEPKPAPASDRPKR